MTEKVLFLCTGNSARSQMAEGFLNRMGDGLFQAYSAGLDPRGLNPYTLRVMAELGYDLSNNRSKSVDEFLGKVHLQILITVCAHAEKNCPSVWPGVVERIHWSIDDPAAAKGSDEEILEAFRRARDELQSRVAEFVRSRPAG